MKPIIVQGNLLKAPDKYIVHQCNCVSENSKHLSQSMFNAFPYANCYGAHRRENPNQLGTIQVCGNGQDQRYVINLFGQYFPGNVKYPDGSKDNVKVREWAFESALEIIAEIPDLESIGFPWRIGCGAAGGDWDKYLKKITDFAANVYFDSVTVRIYKFE